MPQGNGALSSRGGGVGVGGSAGPEGGGFAGCLFLPGLLLRDGESLPRKECNELLPWDLVPGLKWLSFSWYLFFQDHYKCSRLTNRPIHHLLFYRKCYKVKPLESTLNEIST